MSGTGIEVSTGGFVVPAMNATQAAAHMKAFQELKAALLTDTDYVKINGKPYIKRSGYRKFALAFNITDEIVKETKEIHEQTGTITWTIHVRASAPSGRSCIGVAKCTTTEKTFSHPDHDSYATAHTRAKNRAISDLIGSGEVSAEEMAAQDANAKATQFFNKAGQKV